jgi:hypothetical protein
MVRGTAYRWGGTDITHAYTFPPNGLILHVHNDRFGEDVALTTAAGAAPPTKVGTLHAGESTSIPIQNITAVLASCTLQSRVCCDLERA